MRLTYNQLVVSREIVSNYRTGGNYVAISETAWPYYTALPSKEMAVDLA
jgi:hypothetical protein